MVRVTGYALRVFGPMIAVIKRTNNYICRNKFFGRQRIMGHIFLDDKLNRRIIYEKNLVFNRNAIDGNVSYCI